MDKDFPNQPDESSRLTQDKTTEGNSTPQTPNKTIGTKEITLLNQHESTSQGILEVAGLQQTVNIAVLFVKADLNVNALYYSTLATIVVTILSQILLSCLVAAKIWIRKCEEVIKKEIESDNPDGGDSHEKGKEDLKKITRRLRKLDFCVLLLVLFITILTTILLAISGMMDVSHVIETPMK
ncbi:uncharacterized protein [Antedon mediterranea]|uniref:uncharacterized protein n=1 Tax=Antedon mediterranea TaxID=105859 RepID=UPI003AF8E785